MSKRQPYKMVIINSYIKKWLKKLSIWKLLFIFVLYLILNANYKQKYIIRFVGTHDEYDYIDSNSI